MAVTNPCTTEKDLFDDVIFCRGKKSMPGTRSYAYFIKKKNIITWPAVNKDEAASMADFATLKGDFILDADKKWLRIDLEPDVNDVHPQSVGEGYSKSFRNSVTLVIPGTEEEATGLAALLNNDDAVFLVPQKNGKFRLIGNEMSTVEIKPEQELGKKTEDHNHTVLNLTVDDEFPAPFYPGKIETKAGDISGATGKPLPGEALP